MPDPNEQPGTRMVSPEDAAKFQQEHNVPLDDPHGHQKWLAKKHQQQVYDRVAHDEQTIAAFQRGEGDTEPSS